MATTTTKLVLGFRSSAPTRAEIPAISISPIHRSKVGNSIHLNICRYGDVKGSNMRRRMMPIAFADPSERDIVKGKTEGNETSNAQGPPVLTILAGFIVFSLVAWILGSTVAWLISLVFNVAPPK